mmetsp:Transcript_55645/g.63535  ORF Transcript_55645/g.63535 Transcript_55645/m.63535 type:complete len:500 (+) Transcript_55645:58-1557(+)|eukprot:CAMPEP_0115012128 /NCGR_PEP_ID=MMETSP0216-20121206/24516_1 /TAXON_ID=223996 /ORGANISM="Protocruzia adherens, Strain Boccale" /LENGTH=499 /DNA_ID=CAMNT_0002381053 /DNA_START=28 /DNA_END=1527 /DNA_ORIENTATION=+
MESKLEEKETEVGFEEKKSPDSEDNREDNDEEAKGEFRKISEETKDKANSSEVSSVSSGKYHPAFVSVRIKPLSGEPEQGHSGVAAAKRLSKFTEKSITIGNSEKGSVIKAFSFPTTVIPPEMDQESTYQTLAAPLVERFVEGYDVNFLAFGQTGSGKTHTIFGPPGSMANAAKLLKSRDCSHETASNLILDCHGILIRACFDAVKFMKQRENSGIASCILEGSMVEVYFDQAQDLLNNKVACSLDDTDEWQGLTHISLDTPDNIIRLAAAAQDRTTNTTRMNESSSRSHCITTLKLTQYLPDSDEIVVSRFHFFDLMGSERSKGSNSAHDERINNKETISGCEGIYANWTLHQFSLCVQRVYDLRKKKGITKPMKKASKKTGDFIPYRLTFLTRILAGSLFGTSLTSMVLTLSQAARNGEECYQSLQYGEAIARLPTNPVLQPSHNFEKLRAKARTELVKSKEALKRTSVEAYVTIRKAQIQKWMDLLINLEKFKPSS